MRKVRVACGSATPAVVITVGPAHVGMSWALTQEATVSSATESLGNPAAGVRDPLGPHDDGTTRAMAALRSTNRLLIQEAHGGH